jgi:hypothetical protein
MPLFVKKRYHYVDWTGNKMKMLLEPEGDAPAEFMRPVLNLLEGKGR